MTNAGVLGLSSCGADVHLWHGRGFNRRNVMIHARRQHNRSSWALDAALCRHFTLDHNQNRLSD